MTFRPRRQPIGQASRHQIPSPTETPLPIKGVRPSPLDGRPTTSTGTRSIDQVLASHAGLPLGNALLIGENGTTDFSGYILKYFAAEGLVQGHMVHILGMDEFWGRELPGLAAEIPSSKPPREPNASDRMKIAWRYERLGEFGADARDRKAPPASDSESPYCHNFDLSKRLVILSLSNIKFVPICSQFGSKHTENNSSSPLLSFVNHLLSQLEASHPRTIHRVVIPNLLSPVYYTSEACQPHNTLQFFHALRALLRRYPNQLAVMTTIPLMMHPRNTGLTRWMELLNDGVIELIPFPLKKTMQAKSHAGSIKTNEEFPQGIFKIHKLPVFHEKGGGSGELNGYGIDLAFTFTRRKGLVIKPFSLPPVEGDNETPKDDSLELHPQNSKKFDIEF